MRLGYVKYITVFGLVVYTYILLKDDIKDRYYAVLEESVEQETLNRIKTLLESKKTKELAGTPAKEKGEKLKAVNQSLYFQEALLKYDLPISLPMLDSIFRSKLTDENVSSGFKLEHVKVKGQSVIQSTDSISNLSIFDIRSEIVPIRLDGSEGMQGVLINPYLLIFERLGLLLIATILMMIFVAGCIIYQIKVILLQNKIAELREDFSYAMIHDMKSPLTSILMGVQMLQSGKLEDKPEKKEKSFRVVIDEAEHLLTLTNKVLTLSKLENGKLEMNKQDVVIAPLIDNLIQKFTLNAEKLISFSTDIRVRMVYADKDHLIEAISNLIDNAIKYSGQSVCITITVCSDDMNTLIKVKDDGFGISHEDRKTIFEKFERASATGKTRGGGAPGFGLGLNYVFRVAEAHDGRVWVDSVEGEYSEFTVYLPQQI